MTTYSTNNLARPKNAGIEKLRQRATATTKTIEFRILTVVWTALMLWGAAIAIFGYPALIIVALALVPTMFTFLMLITVGK